MDEMFFLNEPGTENSDASVSCKPENCAACSGCAETIQAKQTITLTLEDDSELNCFILTVFPSGEHEYIALLPMEGDEILVDGEVYLYRFSLDDNGDPVLENIENDEEYQSACDSFQQTVEQAEKIL